MGPLSTKHGIDESSSADVSQKTSASGQTSGDLSSDNTNSDIKNENQVYYAVHIPADSQILTPDVNDCSSSVFEDKMEALKLVKKYKRARFKAFNSLAEATQFTVNGVGLTSIAQPVQSSASNLNEDQSPVTETLPLSVGEKPSPFKGPKSQDLVRLRKSIESGDIQCVEKTVWENPRYLVSSGDTPAILHEGSRYNALHICAKNNKGAICALILKTISDVDFIRRLYGDNSESIEAAQDRCNVLLDLYLNTPDKGCNETPLHFAVKHGSVDVVQVLVAFSQCDKTMLNKYGHAPKDIICSRVSDSGDSGDTHIKIALLLEDQYFIPVLRSQDPSVQPTIGQPFSPTKPLNLSGDVMSPVLEVQGVAGPMPLDEARAFRRKWKTPPRDSKTQVPALLKTMLQDTDKGLERVGRELAEENNVCWKEFWPFLKTFTNFRTAGGLDLLEQYLLKRFKQGTDPVNGNKGIVINKTPLFSGISRASASLSPVSPVSELCAALHSCKLSDGNDPKKPVMPPLPVPPPPIQNNLQNHEHYNGIIQSDDTSVAISPHLYIEKSCQVFAKRITDGLLRCPDAPAEPIACEVIYLNMLVASCLNDARFATVNFNRLHCHLATCLLQKFDLEDREILVKTSDIILNKRQELDESSSEEEITPYRDNIRRKNTRKQKIAVDASVRCIAQQISNCLLLNESPDASVSDPPSTEEDCIKLWQLATTCNCVWSPDSRIRRSFRRCNYSVSRRIDFQSSVSLGERKNEDEIKNIVRIIEKPPEYCEESAGEESDTSECGEFFTPPSTPRNPQSLASSEDDLEMESPDEGPDVYIEGDVPTSLDSAVLDALGPTNLDPIIYPNICRWKHLVTMHSPAQRERWPSPRRVSVYTCEEYNEKSGF
ncbi:ankyrin repeat and LEM domain-containing protein 2 [Lycorma delicatula]|uniref:ankyrin repeat and LEM domain-containing protein 2 n=1 Tax=Lycorma delicatula TaxID=130591 RepID=UPI003F517698